MLSESFLFCIFLLSYTMTAQADAAPLHIMKQNLDDQETQAETTLPPLQSLENMKKSWDDDMKYLKQSHQETSPVYGIEQITVPVYFHLSSKNILRCRTEALASEKLDAKYTWTSPTGPVAEMSRRLTTTSTGDLILHHIKGSDAGNYTCFLRYILASTNGQVTLNYLVYVYHHPEISIHATVSFFVKSCESSLNTKFKQYIEETLENLIKGLNCEEHLMQTDCKKEKRPGSLSSYILHYKFGVYPKQNVLPFESDTVSSMKPKSGVKEAVQRIQNYFEEQADNPSSEFSYMKNSFIEEKILICKEGFGKGLVGAASCPECCVACFPGFYSTNDQSVCLRCPPGTYNPSHGQTHCRKCPHKRHTSKEGAEFVTQCYSQLPSWSIILITVTVTAAILISIFVLFWVFRRKLLAATYIKEISPEKKKIVKGLGKVVQNVDLKEAIALLRPVPCKLKPKPKLPFLEEIACASATTKESESSEEESTPATSNPSESTEDESMSDYDSS
ncbi:zona pellucida-binding protein 1-like [Erpetoichthys calabaricus]|uniref:zona pellucida-binding protein 1-like n=1 Tax=Erpetoichthys calabaricus TaxID=27687 RepID=UPI002233E72D|nr:zona pellucida-binding protein 1-like [Erpetoichthys calabaricus]